MAAHPAQAITLAFARVEPDVYIAGEMRGEAFELLSPFFGLYPERVDK
jgi:hypothetical protein